MCLSNLSDVFTVCGKNLPTRHKSYAVLVTRKNSAKSKANESIL